MAITGYAFADAGFGAYIQRGREDKPHFETSFKVVAYSQATSLSEAYVTGFPQVLHIRVTLVYDNEAKEWREYYTGLKFNIIPESICNNIETYGDYFKYDVNGGSLKVYKELTAANLERKQAVEFERIISNAKEKNIKNAVKELYAAMDEAKRWGEAFDRVVEEVKAERAKKESGIPDAQSKIEAGFGKYGLGLGSEAKGVSQGASSKAPTAEDMLRWIRLGRCSFCGGEFTGFLSKRCFKCGKPKDY